MALHAEGTELKARTVQCLQQRRLLIMKLIRDLLMGDRQLETQGMIA
mgnify:CR=1 FL=1